MTPRTIVGPWVMSLIAAVAMSACLYSNGGSTLAQPATIISSIEVSSPEFTEDRPRKRIPKKYTCLGEDLSPPLDWNGVPEDAQSLAIIAEDPDEKTGTRVHWILYNIPVSATGLPEAVSTDAVLTDGTTQGTNDFNNNWYNGPCPGAKRTIVPRYNDLGIVGAHRYIFRIYALDFYVNLPSGATKAELLTLMEGHVLGQGETVGKYMAPAVMDATSYNQKGTSKVRTAIAQGTPYGEGGAY